MPEANDSARARMLAGPMLAATAAETWLEARALDATRVSDSQPGGPTRPTAASAALPAWIEAGALADPRLRRCAGSRERRAARGPEAHRAARVALHHRCGRDQPNAMEIVGRGISRLEPGRRRLPRRGGDACTRAARRGARRVAAVHLPVRVGAARSFTSATRDSSRGSPTSCREARRFRTCSRRARRFRTTSPDSTRRGATGSSAASALDRLRA